MAVALDVAGDALIRTTNLPTITAFTAMGWFRITVDRNIETCMLCLGQATGGTFYYLGTVADGTGFSIYNGTTNTSGTQMSVGTWVHLAMTVAGTGAGQFLGYLNGSQAGVLDGAAAVTAAKLWIGNDPASEFLNGRAAAVKLWSGAVLTANEIGLEMRQYLPVRTTNLNGFYPLLLSTDVKDYSAAANPLTVTGTLATEDGPPIPWTVALVRRRRRAAAAAVVRSQGRPAVYLQAVSRAATI